MSLQTLNNILNYVYQAAINSEDELTHDSATLILASLFELYSTAPRYASYANRLTSYEGFSKYVCDQANQSLDEGATAGQSNTSMLTPVAEFAAVGFYHTSHKDETVCVVCGLGLMDWQPTDQAAACHARFSAASAKALSDKLAGHRAPTERLCPNLPCLYLAVYHLLTSELPSGTSQGVPLTGNGSNCSAFIANLSARLRAVASSLEAPPLPEGWPVENALSLGYNENLIALALWKRQSYYVSTKISLVPFNNLKIGSQDTAVLLKTLLRLQESGLADEGGNSLEQEENNRHELSDYAKASAVTVMPENASHDSKHQKLTLQGASDSGRENKHSCVQLPNFCLLIKWWNVTWPEFALNTKQKFNCRPRRKAFSASA